MRNFKHTGSHPHRNIECQYIWTTNAFGKCMNYFNKLTLFQVFGHFFKSIQMLNLIKMSGGLIIFHITLTLETFYFSRHWPQNKLFTGWSFKNSTMAPSGCVHLCCIPVWFLPSSCCLSLTSTEQKT